MLPQLLSRHFVAGIAEKLIDFLINNFGGFFDLLKDFLQILTDNLETLFSAIPPILIIIIIAALVFYKTRKYSITFLSLLGIYLIFNMRLWNSFIETLTLMTIAIFFSLLFAIPLGILMAKFDLLNNIITPVLNFMQTMHPFVYLIPIVFIFGLGKVPGVISTMIFAIPPAARPVNLGIRQVDKEYIEAGHAFGATPMQLLFKIEIPLALPAILQGVNQCIMLSLSMVIVVAMIASGGLGADIMKSISRLKVGAGIEAGLAVVILGMILDIITTSQSKKNIK